MLEILCQLRGSQFDIVSEVLGGGEGGLGSTVEAGGSQPLLFYSQGQRRVLPRPLQSAWSVRSSGTASTSRRRLQLRGPLRRHCRLSLTLTRSHRWSRSRSYRPSLTTSHRRSRCARSRRWTTQHYVDWALGNQSCTPPHSPSAGFRRAGGGAGGEGGAQWRTYTHARVGALFTMVTQERIIV